MKRKPRIGAIHAPKTPPEAGEGRRSSYTAPASPASLSSSAESAVFCA